MDLWLAVIVPHLHELRGKVVVNQQESQPCQPAKKTKNRHTRELASSHLKNSPVARTASAAMHSYSHLYSQKTTQWYKVSKLNLHYVHLMEEWSCRYPFCRPLLPRGWALNYTASLGKRSSSETGVPLHRALNLNYMPLKHIHAALCNASERFSFKQNIPVYCHTSSIISNSTLILNMRRRWFSKA